MNGIKKDAKGENDMDMELLEHLTREYIEMGNSEEDARALALALVL